MTLVQNFPFFCIILSMMSAIITFAIKGKPARYLHLFVVAAVSVMSLFTLFYVMRTGESYVFMMGHFPAPWGNEIRIGTIEAFMAFGFALIMFFSDIGGLKHIEEEISPSKQNLFYIFMNLLLSSLLALIYTNDLFTAYVFIEINTIAACGLIMIRRNGRAYASAMRYMIMSLVGSGLFLLGLSMLYGITGQLLMSPAKEAISQLIAHGEYQIPLSVILVLMTIGLCVKSGLFPFHTWIPDAYAYTTPTASAVLSSLVSKGYIFLLIKIMYRVAGIENIVSSHILNILYVLGLIAMIMGSVVAISQNNIFRMIAFSSVAQIGYIFMGIGLGGVYGFTAALFHIVSHGVMKSLLFISGNGLVDVSDGKRDFESIKGAGYRNKTAGVTFTIAGLSMMGIPVLTGFISKYLFAVAAFNTPGKMMVVLLCLAVSTFLNTVYFGRTIVTIYYPVEAEKRKPLGKKPSLVENFGMFGLALLNILMGFGAYPVVRILMDGLRMFD